MRKPITTEEAMRAVHDGGIVWRSMRRYDLPPPGFMLPGDVRWVDCDETGERRAEGGCDAIDWLLFRTLTDFEVEVDEPSETDQVADSWGPTSPVSFGDIERWSKEQYEAMNGGGSAPTPNNSSLDIPAGANGPGEPQWLTAGQALDWMVQNEGKILVDDLGYIWRRCGYEVGWSSTRDAISNMKVTPKAFESMIGRRFLNLAQVDGSKVTE